MAKTLIIFSHFNEEPPGLEAKGLSRGPSPAPFQGVALGDGMACAHWCRLEGTGEGEGVRHIFFYRGPHINSFSASMLNRIMLVAREAEYYARYTLAAGGGEFRSSPNRP